MQTALTFHGLKGPPKSGTQNQAVDALSVTQKKDIRYGP